MCQAPFQASVIQGNTNTDPDLDLMDLTGEVGKRTFIKELLEHITPNQRAVRGDRHKDETQRACDSLIPEGLDRPSSLGPLSSSRPQGHLPQRGQLGEARSPNC